MPGRSPERPAVHVCLLECCPTSETLARISLGCSTAACSLLNDQALAEPDTVGCHTQPTHCTDFTQQKHASQSIPFTRTYNDTSKTSIWLQTKTDAKNAFVHHLITSIR